MAKGLGRGFLGSLSKRVEEEVRELYKDNEIIRRERHSYWHRLVRGWLVDRTMPAMLAVYFAIASSVMAAEIVAYKVCADIPETASADKVGDFLTDVGSYLLAAQVGILAIVSVAVAVVTLLSQGEQSATVKSDVRLYYVESFSYELTTSSVALLLVLTVQLFWPAELLLHQLGYGGANLTPALVLTAVHAAWFAFNVLLFLQFTTTTLRFVEPGAREHMRERYAANLVIPRDLRTRLFRALYSNAPSNVFGGAALAEGPSVSFGHGLIDDDDATTEIQREFDRPHVLADVWLSPLAVAIRSWRKRTQKQGERRERMFGSLRWNGELAVSAAPGHAADHMVLLERNGGVPLRRWERFLIKHSLRFRKANRRDDDLPTTSDFLEGLIDKMVAQIDKAAVTSFNAAYEEATRFHKFILAAQNTRDEGGNVINLAEVGGLWSRPDEEWVRAYRRAYDAAAEKLSVNTDFMERLAYLPYRLLPADATTFSQRPIIALVDLGAFQVIALEAWVTKNTQPSYNPLGDTTARLAGSDARAYEAVLIQLVGAWEAFQNAIIQSTGLRKLKKKSAEEQWRHYGAAWPILLAHLKASAYFLTSAVWNEDDPGEQRFRDHLLRWCSPLYEELGRDYAFYRTYLLVPSLLAATWGEAVEYAKPTLRFQQAERATPPSIFGEVLRTTHRDVVTIVAALTLSWYADEQQATDIGARAAVRLMRRETLDEGSDLTARTSAPYAPFRAAFDLLLRNSLEPSVGSGRYGIGLDDLVRQLGSVASSRMVPGRVYSGWGVEGVDTIKRALFAIMAADLPTDHEKLITEVASLADDGGSLAQPDALRNAIRYFQRLANEVGQTPDPAFERATRAFGAEIDVGSASSALRAILTSVAEALREKELAKLRAAELDPEAVAHLRRRMSEAVLREGPKLVVFRDIPIRLAKQQEEVQEFTFGRIDKGAYFRPPMSALDRDELDGLITEALRDGLAGYFWRSFRHQPREEAEIGDTGRVEDFWRVIVEHAQRVAEPRVALVPRHLGEPVGMAAWEIPGQGLDDFLIERKDNLGGGGGLAYVGTLNGIDVYQWNDDRDALLFCPLLAETLDYAPVGPNGEVVDFEFVDDDNPSESQVKLRFSQSVTWRVGTIIHFTIVERHSASPVRPEAPTDAPED
ncbi:hypothetical protein [Phenylobacterium sp.]|uniref:hypothetical protein n=1 Tax=Phenylobacterium sp. TaxID=1871053 RepID=UPI003D296B61